MSLTRTHMGIYVLDEDTVFSRMVEFHATLTPPDTFRELAFVSPLIPEGGVVIDAGAFIGDHASLYSQIVGASGHVYAIEPHPVTVQALNKNMARFNNVSVVSTALGDEDCLSVLSMTPNLGASFIGVDAEFPNTKVGMTTLDLQLLPFLDRCDFIHLDAEGMELKILRGAEQLIDRFHPALLVEVTDDWLRRYGCSQQELLDWLELRDYQVTRMQTNPNQFDVICVPRTRQTLDSARKLVNTQAV